MILLWSVATDRSYARVEAELRALGITVAFLDQRAFAHTAIELRCGPDIAGTLSVGAEEIRLADVTGVYIRPRNLSMLEELSAKGPGDPLWRHAVALEEALVAWMEIVPIRVINRPSATAANDAKPRQLQQLRDLGFTVPSTIVTTDPEVARAFVAGHPRVIFRAVSSARSPCGRHRCLLSVLPTCPSVRRSFRNTSPASTIAYTWLGATSLPAGSFRPRTTTVELRCRDCRSNLQPRPFRMRWPTSVGGPHGRPVCTSLVWTSA